MIELQTALMEHGLNAVLAKYDLSASRHSKYSNLVSLKYKQCTADFKEPAVRQARGIVLDESNGWAIVAKGYDKFFNIGESLGYSLDEVENWTAYEKLDGSLLMLYCYNDEWFFASSGRAWHEDLHALAMPLLDKQMSLHPDNTYCFELIGPCNLHVVQYNVNQLVLHGVFNQGIEIGGTELAPIDNWQELLNSRTGLEAEGFVLVGPNGERAKAKSADYVALHRIANGFNAKSVAQIVAEGEWSEVYALWPARLEPYTYMLAEKALLEAEFEWHYTKAGTQKEFAMAIKHLRSAPALFSVRAGKHDSFNSWLADNSEKLVK